MSMQSGKGRKEGGKRTMTRNIAVKHKRSALTNRKKIEYLI